MRLGLVTDIHSEHHHLSTAIDFFKSRKVDKIVTIGDTCEAFASADDAEVVAGILLDCDAVGVWGNHDFNFCHETPDSFRTRFGKQTFAFMSRMKPSLQLGECFFSHKEANIDPFNVEQLWGLGEPPLDLMKKARSAFNACESRIMFVGHYHRWWAAAPTGQLDWTGETPLTLHPDQRCFVVVAALQQGNFAVFNTESNLLEPFNVLNI